LHTSSSCEIICDRQNREKLKFGDNILKRGKKCENVKGGKQLDLKKSIKHYNVTSKTEKKIDKNNALNVLKN
jgi:hypothetical protein